ncbi:MAG: TonB-dependent receptor [Chitinophagaceae bacterium]|nr:TonB-dependent receptor [Chitinophagaceae bacterium]
MHFSEKFRVNLQSRTISDRKEFIYGDKPGTLKGYTLVDFYLDYNINEQFRLFADLRNITNTKYVDWKGFNTRRFNFIVGARWSL